MKTKQTLKKIFLLVFCLVTFFGCMKSKKEPIKIGTNQWIGYQPLYLARSLGYFNDTEINLTEMPCSSDVIRAFRNDMIDCAALTLDESYLLLQDSFDLKILFIMDISNGADILLAKPEIKNVQNLKGKKVAVENSAVGAYTLCRALELNDVLPSEIQIVTKIIAGHEQAYKSGEVDAVVTFEPTSSKLKECGAVVLFNSKQIPNEIFDVFVVKNELLRKRPEDVMKIKKMWFKTLDYMKSNMQKVAPIISNRLSLTPNQFVKSLEGVKFPDNEENDKILAGNFIKSATHVEQIMHKEKLLVAKIDPSKLIINK